MKHGLRLRDLWYAGCYAIGAASLVLWLLAVLNVIDFHVCINSPGHCKIVDPTRK